MNKINTKDIPEEEWWSPKGRFSTADRNISIALGREPQSTDLLRRHPFDVAICRVPAGKAACPYHSHSAQWEFYHVISGTGSVRHGEGRTAIGPGDAFLFEPGSPHQIESDPSADMIFYVVADNPIGESGYYPDSGKWIVRSPERRLIRSEGLEYLDGEE
jgi:uncharacterized cupin superfamily protein